MIAETVIVGLVLFAGLWLVAFGTNAVTAPGAKAVLLGLVVAATAALLSVLARDWRPRPEHAVELRPIKIPAGGYVTSSTCRACHADQYESWHASYHRTMTQVATPQSVAGDFLNLDPHYADKLFRKGNEFFVRLSDERATPADTRRIELTTGSHHYQAYWYGAGRGRRLQLVPAIYLIDEQQWIPRDAAFLTPPDTSAATLRGEWNANCIKCHTTHGRPRVTNPMAQSEDALLDTHVAEFGIACEACHGPAQEHVRTNRNPLRRYRQRWKSDSDPTIVQPERMDHRRSSEICGQCHSVFEFPSDDDILRYIDDGFAYRPGDKLSDTRVVVRPAVNANTPLLQEKRQTDPDYFAERFWPDGMVRVSGREFNGLIESPCYQRGQLSCLSCHQMHKRAGDPRSLKEWANDQLKPGMETNQACLQCHQQFADNIEEHTHHAADSSGSLCYNCHMPHTTYGLLKAIRSHQIDSPSAANSLATGRPNACNLCHLDKTLSWTADYLAQWYDAPSVELDAQERSIAASLLWTLRGNAVQRALVAWSMGWNTAQEASGTNWLAPYLAELLDDQYDAVRFIAYRSIRTLPAFTDLEFDFMSPPAERKEVKQRVLEQWNDRHDAATRVDSSEILLNADGTLQQTTIDRLLRDRDVRPMNLAE
jgi:hypothetical protein